MKTSTTGRGQRMFRAISAPVARQLWDIERVGFDRLPADGPAILCPNHISFLDSAFLMLSLPRNINFVGKAEYMDSWKTKFLFPMLGMIPINRSDGRQASAALDVAAGVLERGGLFGIFPEGTRSRTGLLNKGRTGAARLAFRTGAPIYPVGISGTDAIQPPEAKMPRLGGSCRIEIGRPVRPERYTGRSDRLAWRSMIDEVMFEISQLSGQTYRDAYAGDPDPVDPTTAVPGTIADARRAETSDPPPEALAAQPALA